MAAAGGPAVAPGDGEGAPGQLPPGAPPPGACPGHPELMTMTAVALTRNTAALNCMYQIQQGLHQVLLEQCQARQTPEKRRLSLTKYKQGRRLKLCIEIQ